LAGRRTADGCFHLVSGLLDDRFCHAVATELAYPASPLAAPLTAPPTAPAAPAVEKPAPAEDDASGPADQPGREVVGRVASAGADASCSVAQSDRVEVNGGAYDGLEYVADDGAEDDGAEDEGAEDEGAEDDAVADGVHDEDEDHDEDDPVYEELEGTEGAGEAGSAAEAADEDDDDDVAGGDVVEDDVAGVDVAGVNDGLRFRGVKMDSRSGPASSVFDSFFGDGLSSVTDEDDEADEADENKPFFGFPILSAGSGGTAPFAGSSLALAPELPFALGPALPLAAGDAAGATGAAGAEAEAEFPLSSAHDDDPPALVRDDDVVPLSVTVSSASTSGSVSRTGGAIMNGVRVVGPASSTPSSSVLTVPLRTFA